MAKSYSLLDDMLRAPTSLIPWSIGEATRCTPFAGSERPDSIFLQVKTIEASEGPLCVGGESCMPICIRWCLFNPPITEHALGLRVWTLWRAYPLIYETHLVWISCAPSERRFGAPTDATQAVDESQYPILGYQSSGPDSLLDIIYSTHPCILILWTVAEITRSTRVPRT